MKILMNTNNFTTFKGTFKQNEILDDCIRKSKDSDLKKFEKTLNKMKSVDDNWEYSLNIEKSTNTNDSDRIKCTRKLVLTSNSLGTFNSRTIAEETVDFWDNFTGKIYKKALKKVSALIEDDYKKAKSYNSSEDLKQRIYTLLKPQA